MVDLNALVPWRNNKTQTPAKREDYFDPFMTFRREMDRMFERFFDGFPIHTGNGWRNVRDQHKRHQEWELSVRSK